MPVGLIWSFAVHWWDGRRRSVA